MIDSKEIFLELHRRISEGASADEISKEYGGSNIYIPSYKSMGRNEHIRAEHKELCAKMGSKRAIKELSHKYALTPSYINYIIGGQKGLF